MTIQLNGKEHPLESEMILTDLLATIGVHGKPVIVELNKNPVLTQNFSKTEIRPGDALEIVALAAGG